MKTIEKVYIGLSILPFIGFLLLMEGFLDLYFGRSGAWIVLLFFPFSSFILGILGIVLILKAKIRKAALWPLMLATLMASSYAIFIFGRMYLKIF